MQSSRGHGVLITVIQDFVAILAVLLMVTLVTISQSMLIVLSGFR